MKVANALDSVNGFKSWAESQTSPSPNMHFLISVSFFILFYLQVLFSNSRHLILY